MDLKLVELLNQRARMALRIAEAKRAIGLSNRCPDREKEVLRNAAAHNPGPLDEVAIRRILRAVMAECLRLEEVATGDRGDEAGRDPPADRGRK
ncbi:chorismate mutase [Candidatus Bipolaricaulota bacterium]|nr:chorismate mutase [Candidatus Bipolaricaulota bacterium]